MKKRDQIVNEIAKMSNRMRKKVLDMALAAGTDSSHFGGGLSIIEITATLYGKIMRTDKDNPQWIERVMSGAYKGQRLGLNTNGSEE